MPAPYRERTQLSRDSPNFDVEIDDLDAARVARRHHPRAVAAAATRAW